MKPDYSKCQAGECEHLNPTSLHDKVVEAVRKQTIANERLHDWTDSDVESVSKLSKLFTTTRIIKLLLDNSHKGLTGHLVLSIPVEDMIALIEEETE